MAAWQWQENSSNQKRHIMFCFTHQTLWLILQWSNIHICPTARRPFLWAVLHQTQTQRNHILKYIPVTVSTKDIALTYLCLSKYSCSKMESLSWDHQSKTKQSQIHPAKWTLPKKKKELERFAEEKKLCCPLTLSPITNWTEISSLTFFKSFKKK